MIFNLFLRFFWGVGDVEVRKSLMDLCEMQKVLPARWTNGKETKAKSV